MIGNLNKKQEEVSKNSIILSARSYITSMLEKLPEDLKESSSEVALEIICDELRKMPVPLLGTILASTMERAFGKEQGMGRNFSGGAIEMLQQIQTSNQFFESELMVYNIHLDEVIQEIALLKQFLMEKNESSCLRIIRPTINLKDPHGDNEIQFILANTGVGSVVVEEIFLEVEKWEAETTINYSLPAAPLNLFFLWAELTIHETQYPLFKLNKELERTFNEKGDGADKIIISLASLENACYSLRLRIPYIDLITGKSNTLYYPPIGEEPIIVPFYFAPGWKYINPMDLLNRKILFQDLEAKLKRILAIFEAHNQSDPSRDQKLCEILDELGVWYSGYASIAMDETLYFLNCFIPPFISMAVLEKKQEVLEIILKILCYQVEYYFDDFLKDEYREAIDSGDIEYYLPEYFKEMVMLVNNPKVEKILENFMLESEFTSRIKLVPQILSKMNPLT